MKLNYILTMALSRVDETLEDVDSIALSVMKNAVNQAYIDVRSTIDRRVIPYTIDPATNPVELPADCIEIIRIVHSVEGEYSDSEYYRDGDQLYFYPRIPAGTFTLSYVQAPTLALEEDPPEEDTSLEEDSSLEEDPPLEEDPYLIEIDVKDIYVHAIITFAAYAYQLYRRKYASADILLREYQSFMQPEAEKPKN
jgi:hypothetical protein